MKTLTTAFFGLLFLVTLAYAIDSGSMASRMLTGTSGTSIQYGQCTLDGGGTSTCTVTVAYTNSTSYVCALSTQTSLNIAKITRTSSTVVTVTSAVTLDSGVVNVICVGT